MTCSLHTVSPTLTHIPFMNRDLSDNGFTASLPCFHPKAPVTNVLLHSNYFEGGTSNLNRSGACISPKSTVTLAANCLSKPRPCAQLQQSGTTCNIQSANCPRACCPFGSSATPTCPCTSDRYVVLDGGEPRCASTGMSCTVRA